MEIPNPQANETDTAFRQRCIVCMGEQLSAETPVMQQVHTSMQLLSAALPVRSVSCWAINEQNAVLYGEAYHNVQTGDFTSDSGKNTLAVKNFSRYLIEIQKPAIVTAITEYSSLYEKDGVLSHYGIGWLQEKRIVVAVEPQQGNKSWTDEEQIVLTSILMMLRVWMNSKKDTAQTTRPNNEQYRQMVEYSNDGIYQTDLRGKITFANAAAFSLFGYAPNELLGTPFYRIVQSNYRPKTLRLYHQQLQKRLASTYHEFPVLKNDGTELWLGQNVQLLFDAGAVVGFQAIVRDISQQKLAEGEVLKTLEKERQLGELKSRFVAMVLHELRTPLTGISLSTEMLQRYAGRIDEDQKNKSYRKIFDNIKRIIGLMDGILLLSETETNKLSFKPSPMDYEEFCRRLLTEIMAENDQLQPDSIKFSIEGCLHTDMGDETLLRHILNHLLINGIKYSLHSSVAVEFSVKAEGEFLTFTVRDYGIGIPEEDLPFIFETFHRAKNASQLIPGTGVGLSVVKQCVTMHQGTIEVRSVLNEGTTFIITIPRHYSLSRTSPTVH